MFEISNAWKQWKSMGTYYNWPVSHSARHQCPARERQKIHIASRENVDNQTSAIQILHISMFQFTFKCRYNDFISKYTDINSLHVTQINLLHNNTCCSTYFVHFRCKKGCLCVNSVTILHCVEWVWSDTLLHPFYPGTLFIKKVKMTPFLALHPLYFINFALHPFSASCFNLYWLSGVQPCV